MNFSIYFNVRFFDFFQNRPQIFPPVEILSPKSSILPIAMKVGSKDVRAALASFALLFVQNYAMLDLGDKISTGESFLVTCFENDFFVKNGVA